jgi:hypothetical protein
MSDLSPLTGAKQTSRRKAATSVFGPEPDIRRLLDLCREMLTIG